MIVKAWNNGAHNRNGSGYGFKVAIADRDAHFKKEWTSILVELPGEDQPLEIQIPQGFWDEPSREVVSLGLGQWLRRNGMALWPLGNPAVFILEPIEENRFRVEKVHKQSSKI